ncbi:ABC-2 family transporter protein [Streptomyces sp. B21-105]|uniref:ABC transporter permease n=1 Tax=Streptomyces sp. B21-105 TaxID=3039417 RepID=UPI0030759D70
MTRASHGDLSRQRASTVQWKVARVTALGEVFQSGRLVGTAVRLTIQVLLTTSLWRALYAETESSAGLDRDQAVTFAVLAALSLQIRGMDRSAARDTLIQHMYDGTVLYWYLRPLPARHYYCIRAVGDQLYGALWTLIGYTACLVSGIVAPPVSGSVAALFAVSLLFGQITVYYLFLLADLICFWTMLNNSAVLILRFIQNLLSGVFAPLWFFPGWFIDVSSFLPFQGTLNTPLSIYVGRIPVGTALREIATQLVWCLLLAGISRKIWSQASKRVTVQGG